MICLCLCLTVCGFNGLGLIVLAVRACISVSCLSACLRIDVCGGCIADFGVLVVLLVVSLYGWG